MAVFSFCRSSIILLLLLSSSNDGWSHAKQLLQFVINTLIFQFLVQPLRQLSELSFCFFSKFKQFGTSPVDLLIHVLGRLHKRDLLLFGYRGDQFLAVLGHWGFVFCWNVVLQDFVLLLQLVPWFVAFASSDLLELEGVPSLIETVFDIRYVHLQVVVVETGAIWANKNSESDRSVSWRLSLAIYAVFIKWISQHLVEKVSYSWVLLIRGRSKWVSCSNL